MKNSLAQFRLFETGEKFRGPGSLGNFSVDPLTATGLFADVLTATIGIITVIAIIWFLFQLITGAVAIISSEGDKGKLAEARGRITYGLLGLVITIGAVFLLDLIGNLLGLDLLNIADLIYDLGL